MPHTYTHTPGSPDYTSRHHLIRRIAKHTWQIISSLPTTTHSTYSAAKAYASEITYPAPPSVEEVQATCAAAGISECETALAVGAARAAVSRGYEVTAEPATVEAAEQESAGEERASGGRLTLLGDVLAAAAHEEDMRAADAFGAQIPDGQAGSTAPAPPLPELLDASPTSPVWDRLWTWAGWGRPEDEGPWRGQGGSVNDWWARGEDMVRSLLALEPEHRLWIDPRRSILVVWQRRVSGLTAQVWLDDGGLQLLGAWDGDRAKWAWAWRAGRMAEEDVDDVALGRVLAAVGSVMGRALWDGVALPSGAG